MRANRSSRHRARCHGSAKSSNEKILSRAQLSVRKRLRQEEKIRTPGARLIRGMGKAVMPRRPTSARNICSNTFLTHII